MALFCRAFLRRTDLFHLKSTVNITPNPILSVFQIREFALRKGTREKKQAIARKNKSKKKVEVKTGFVPKSKDTDLLALNHVKRKFADPGLRTPVDDVYTYKYYQWKENTFADAVTYIRETHHPDVYNVPNARVNISIHLDFEAEKKTKTFDNFHRMAPMPHGFDHGEERNIIAFAKDPHVLEEAKASGAALCGDTSLIKSVQNSEVSMQDFQYVIAHPQILAELLTLRGIMKKKFPSPKTGTLHIDVGNTVKRFMNGISYSAIRDPLEKDFGTIETTIGTLDMDITHIEENFSSLLRDVNAAKPKRPGTFIIRCFMSSPPSKERFKLLHNIYLDKQEKTDDEEIVNTGIIDEEFEIGKKNWNVRDIAFIGNNYSISEKFNRSSNFFKDKLSDLGTDKNWITDKKKEDALFIGNNYSIIKKLVNCDNNKSDALAYSQIQDDILNKGDFTFIGNNYSICKKIDNAEKNTNEITSDNIVFEQVQSNKSDSKLDFDNSLSLSSNDTIKQNNMTENDIQSGIEKFNTWFRESSVHKEAASATEERCIKDNVHDIKNLDYAHALSKESKKNTHKKSDLTSEEIDEENGKFSENLNKVLPLEPTNCVNAAIKDVIRDKFVEKGTGDKIDMSKTENLLMEINTFNTNKDTDNDIYNNYKNLEALDSIYLEPTKCQEYLNHENKDTNILKERLDSNEEISIHSIDNLNHLEDNKKSAEDSSINEFIDEILSEKISTNNDGPSSFQNTEEVLKVLLTLQLQNAKKAAQVEEKILLQKLKVAELELKIKELEWNTLLEKERSKKK